MKDGGMRARLLFRSAMLVAGLCLGGCFPTFQTSKPAADIRVIDESGAPLEGAKVTLATTKRLGVGGPTTFQHYLTDREGKVEIEQEHEWQVQVMLPDGGVSYSWSLCFAKPGFEALPMTLIDFDAPIRVAMYPAKVTSECAWSEQDGMLRVKEREARWIEVAGGEWQTHPGFARLMDETIRPAMEASAREQGIKLRSWSEYRFQYQARGDGLRNTRLFVHAICRAPQDLDLTRQFYSEPDENACFFDTTYVNQAYSDQPKSHFEPLRVVAAKG
jgi:hypothetical protein